MATIVIADDHALLRVGLRRILETHGHEVLAEVADGIHVVTTVSQTRPDVLLLDLGLPGIHGLDVLRDVRRRVPTTKVLVVSAYNREEFVVSALRHGAAGYVLKHSDPDVLLSAIDEVLGGGYYVSPQLETIMVSATPGAADPFELLTQRQREVFYGLARGLQNHQIAKQLFISTRTVETHRKSLLRRLGLKTNTDITPFALRHGILSLDDTEGAPRIES